MGILSQKQTASYSEYAKKWHTAMKEAYAVAERNADSGALKGQNYYDRKIKYTQLQQGDRVLVKNLNERGERENLERTWESLGLYQILVIFIFYNILKV